MRPRSLIKSRRRIRDDRRRARCDGLFDIAVPVCGPAAHGYKQRSRPHETRIVLHAGDLGAPARAPHTRNFPQNIVYTHIRMKPQPISILYIFRWIVISRAIQHLNAETRSSRQRA
jgi:hypothetical protein